MYLYLRGTEVLASILTLTTYDSLGCIYSIPFHFISTLVITHHSGFTNPQFEKQRTKKTACSHQNGSFPVSTTLRYRL